MQKNHDQWINQIIITTLLVSGINLTKYHIKFGNVFSPWYKSLDEADQN